MQHGMDIYKPFKLVNQLACVCKRLSPPHFSTCDNSGSACAQRSKLAHALAGTLAHNYDRAAFLTSVATCVRTS